MYNIANKQVKRKLQRAQLSENVHDFGNYKIHYWDTGTDKPPLILVNGFGAAARFQWYKQVAALEEHFRVIVPNLLYFGESVPLDKNRYLLEDQVELLETLFEALHLDTVSLCGVSYGGLVSAEYTRRHPNKVTQLALLDAPVKYYTLKDVADICSTYNVPSIQDFFVPKEPRDLKLLFGAAYQRPPHVPTFVLKGFHEALYVKNAEHIKQLLHHLEQEQPTYAAKAYDFDVPVLLLWGANDDLVPMHVAEELKAHMKHTELVVIPNTKHMPNLEKAKQVNKVLLQFFMKTTSAES